MDKTLGIPVKTSWGMSAGIVQDMLMDMRGSFRGQLSVGMSGTNVWIPTQDYKSLRVEIMFVPPWLTHRYTHRHSFQMS